MCPLRHLESGPIHLFREKFYWTRRIWSVEKQAFVLVPELRIRIRIFFSDPGIFVESVSSNFFFFFDPGIFVGSVSCLDRIMNYVRWKRTVLSEQPDPKSFKYSHPGPVFGVLSGSNSGFFSRVGFRSGSVNLWPDPQLCLICLLFVFLSLYRFRLNLISVRLTVFLYNWSRNAAEAIS